MRQRTHPITILSNLWRVLYLIVIPVFRGFLSALQQDLFAWARGAWIDILILLLMITISVLRWAFLTYDYDSHVIRVRSGILFRRSTVILWSKVTAIALVETFYLRPFRAAHLRADTMGGSFRNPDLSLLLNRNKAAEFMASHSGQDNGRIKRQYTPKAGSILTMSLLTSNSFAGIIYIATFVSQSGKLLGKEFSDLIVSTFEDLARTLAFGIPPAAAAIAYALLGGWLIGFLLAFSRYKGFVIRKDDTTLNITSGAATLRRYTIGYGDINFLDIRQNILAKLLRIYSLYLSAVGYGKAKNDISCVIPSERAEKFSANRQLLFPDFALSDPAVKSPKHGLYRFISQPLALCIGIPAAMGILISLFPSWASFIAFTGTMSMIPALLFLATRAVSFHTGGVARRDGYYTVCYSSGFSLHTVIIPESKIMDIHLRQSLFQAMKGKKRSHKPETCDLLLHTVAEKQKRHFCRNLPRAELEKLLAEH